MHHTQDGVWRCAAVHQHHLVGRFHARCFIGLECGCGIAQLALLALWALLAVLAQTAGEGAGIQDALPGTIAAARIHRMGSIAHQRHTAKGPLRQRIAIDHRVFQNLFGVADHLWHIQPIEMPVGIGRQKILQLAAQVPVLDDIARRLNLRHPVDQLQAIGLDMFADGIDHHLAD